MTSSDEEYGVIANDINWNNPLQYIDKLRALARENHADSMNLLAILLGDMDSLNNRDEIISLYKRAFELGSVTAANSLSIQYRQWGENHEADIWEAKTLK